MRKHNKWQNISLNQIPVKKLYIFTTFNFEPTSFLEEPPWRLLFNDPNPFINQSIHLKNNF